MGETGVSSIRLQGKKIEELPLGRGEIAKEQLPLAMDIERQNKINNVLKRYPKVSVAYLEGRVREAEHNITGFQVTKDRTRLKISDYQRLIEQCWGKKTYADIEPEIAEVVAGDWSLEEKMRMIRELKEGLAPYSVDALKQQIDQFEENIKRLDETIEQEHKDIAMLRETIGKAQMRDMELRNLGASFAE